MDKYKIVIVRCFKDFKRCGCKRTFKKIYPFQLEEQLDKLVNEGWFRFEVIINGNKQSKVLINKNPCRVGKSEKPPVESNVDEEKSPGNQRCGLNLGLYGGMTEEEFVNALSKCKCWPPRPGELKRK